MLQKSHVNITLLYGNQWTQVSGSSGNYQPCYYPSITHDCNDMTKPIHPLNYTASSSSSSSSIAGRGSVHSTGASQTNTIYTYYTEELANIVTELYKDDFLILNYPIWNGKPPDKATSGSNDLSLFAPLLPR